VNKLAVDRDEPSPGKYASRGFARSAEDGDRDVARVAPATHPVDREAQITDIGVLRQLSKLRVPGQAAGQVDGVHARTSSSRGV
jgi:hypothetical protein